MEKKRKNDIKLYSSASEHKNRESLLNLFKNNPVSDDQILGNLGLFLEPKFLSRILFMDHLYKLSIETQGIIAEFGTHWGQNSILFSELRVIYEPLNRHRKILAFDTFEGFPNIHKKDGTSDLMEKSNLAVPEGYDTFLSKLFKIHESLSPLDHIDKFRVIKGDASVELKKYLNKNPHTIFSLLYFDFDIYKPTLDCLKLIKNHIVKGTVIGFDELIDDDSPGETLALKEVFDLKKIELKRFRYASRVSYFIVG